MSLIKDDCVEIKARNPIFVAKEKGKTYTLNNRSKHVISKIRVDGCVIKEESNKCDYLFKIECPSKNRALFVELKGGALHDAVMQIHSTIDFLKKEISDWQLDARIVSSGNVPNSESLPSYRNLRKTLYKTGGTIERKTLKFIETC